MDFSIQPLDEAISLNHPQRIAVQEKQYAYYIGDKDKLTLYLKTALKKMYSDETINEMLPSFFNITKKIINQLTVVYKKPAKRFIKVNGKIDQKLTDMYNSLLPPNVNKADKRAFRLAKLHNTVLPFIVYDPVKQRFVQKTFSSWFYNVESDNNETLDYVSYETYMNTPEGKKLVTVEFTKDKIQAVDKDGTAYVLDNFASTDNPYGVIPFIIFRIEDSEDFWGTGADLLVEGNEEINFLLTKLTRDDIVMGTSGILMGTNLGEVSSIDENGVRSVVGGRGSIMNVETGMNPNAVPPDLKYVNTEPQIESVLKAIDWKIKALALSYGLNPNSFSVENKVESGFSRLVARFEQSEVRIEDLEACYQYEYDRFDLIRKMYNNLVAENYTDLPYKEGFPEDAELMVDFAEIDIPATTTDLWHDRNMKARYGMENAVDWLLEDNPDLTKEQAQAIIDENLNKYEEFMNRFPNRSITTNLNNNTGVTNE